MPSSDHCTSFSGGLSERINSLAESAPNFSIIFSGSTVFLLDLDIDSDGPTLTGSFLSSLRNFLPSITTISSGLIQLLFLLGCAGFEQSHDCMIVGGDRVNGIEVACPEYRQDPINHEEHEDSIYRNNCKDPLSEDCVLVA